MKKELSAWKKDAINVQNACNSSGVIHALSELVHDLWEIAGKDGHGTKWVNTHPLIILFLDKLNSLAGIQSNTDPIHAAYNYTENNTEEK